MLNAALHHCKKKKEKKNSGKEPLHSGQGSSHWERFVANLLFFANLFSLPYIYVIV